MTLTKHQKFTMVRMNRADIKEAPYNPRRIDKYSRQKLERGLKRNGLVQPIIVNKTTGLLVGGHQRLSILDTLEKSADYELDVAVVEMTDKQAKELVVLLNNQNAMGQWDLDKLSDLMDDIGADFEETGFDQISLESLFPLDDTRMPELFKPTEAAIDTVSEMVKVVNGGQEESDDEEDGDEDAEAGEDVQSPEAVAPEPHQYGDDASRTERVKYVKETLREQGKASLQTELYAFVVFRDMADRGKFMQAIGLTENDKYVPAERLWAFVREE